MKTLSLAKLIFIFGLTLVQAQAQDQIPNLILKQMQLRVEQKNCQSEWVNSLEDYKVFDIKAQGQKLYAAPCSNWGLNMNWSLFLVISDRGGEIVIVKPLTFIRHSSYKGLYSDEVLSDIRWDGSSLTLTSNRTLNGTTLCGEIAGYTWDIGAQDFKVKGIIKNDDCRSAWPWAGLNIEWLPLN